MVFFFNSGNTKIDFRVVRAFAKDADVQAQTGIVADFSAKLILIQGKNEKELASINNLQLRSSRSGVLYVGSDFRQDKWEDENGAQRFGVRTFNFTLMPNHDERDGGIEEHEKFVNELVDEIKEFIENAQKAYDARSQVRDIPANAAALASLARKLDKKDDKTSKTESQGLPI